MAHLTYTKLTDSEVEAELGQLPGWSVKNGQITRTFEFGNYSAGLAFASAVGHLAEALHHHPDLFIGYRKVRVAMSTHDVGGLSPYDFELARRIEALG